MKKWSVGIAIILFALLGVVPLVHDIIIKDKVDYAAHYMEQPGRLLVAAVIGILAGFVAWSMERVVIPMLKRPTVSSNVRRLFWIFVTLTGCVAFYVLSVGPVIWLCQATGVKGPAGVPRIVQIIYTPLMNLPQPMARLLDRYAQFWIGPE